VKTVFLIPVTKLRKMVEGDGTGHILEVVT